MRCHICETEFEEDEQTWHASAHFGRLVCEKSHHDLCVDACVHSMCDGEVTARDQESDWRQATGANRGYP